MGGWLAGRVLRGQDEFHIQRERARGSLQVQDEAVLKARSLESAQLRVVERWKETSTLRFFFRPVSVELSAIGYCSP